MGLGVRIDGRPRLRAARGGTWPLLTSYVVSRRTCSLRSERDVASARAAARTYHGAPSNTPAPHAMLSRGSFPPRVRTTRSRKLRSTTTRRSRAGRASPRGGERLPSPASVLRRSVGARERPSRAMWYLPPHRSACRSACESPTKASERRARSALRSESQGRFAPRRPNRTDRCGVASMPPDSQVAPCPVT